MAWDALGWHPAWLAEIESFPSQTLHHHYGTGRPHHMPDPDEDDDSLTDIDRNDRRTAIKAVAHLPLVPLAAGATVNLGDMTKIAAMIRAGVIDAPDVLVGGTPCQAFSIAGLRGSLEDARGQLSLSYVDLANAIDTARLLRGQPACISVWENVPGVLSTKDNAFGCFLGALAGEDVPLIAPGGRWANAGCVFGPQRTIAWRVMDAQYFGVAQRRRRVFVVSSAREGFNPTAVLFERDGMRRDIAPSRGAGQGIARTTADSVDVGGFTGEGIAGTLTSALGRRNGMPDCGSNPGMLHPVAFGGNDTRGSIDVATACLAKGTKLDFESETFLVHQVSGTLQSNGKAAGSATQQDAESGLLIPTPLTPICAARQTSFGSYVDDGTSSTIKMRDYKDATDLIAYGLPGNWIGRKPENGGNATEPMHDISPCLTSADRHGVAHHLIGAFKGGQGAKAGGIGFDSELSPTLSAADSGSNRAPVVAFDAVGSYRTAGDGAVYDSGDKVAALTTGTDPSANILTFSIQAGATRINPNSGPDGIGVQADIAYTLEARAEVQSVMAFRACGQDGFTPSDVSPPVLSSDGGGAGIPTVAFSENCRGEVTLADGDGGIVGTLSGGGGKPGQGYPAIAFQERGRDGGRSLEIGGDVAYALTAPDGGSRSQEKNVLTGMAVRRLTPRECERLQGFPDDYTLIPGLKKTIRPEKLDHDYIKYLARGGVMSYEQCCNAAADGPRYKALGNSMAVPCMFLLGDRITRHLSGAL